MILVECFTESHIDNIASCLRLRPEVMILIGDMLQMEKPIKRYEQILHLRKQHTKIRPCDIHKKDFVEIHHVLTQIIVQDEEYVIDITGGDETVIMAVGALIAGLEEEKRQHVHVQTYDHQKGITHDNIHDNLSHPCGDVSLTVEQLILLHGGKLHPEAYQPEAECQTNAITGLWQIVTEDPKQWNRSVTLLNEFESRSGFGMEICLQLDQVRDGISKFEEKLPVVQALLKKMKDNGVIDMVSREDTLEYAYRSSLLRHCMLKAGNVLEVKTLLEGRGVLRNGKPYFCDNRMSVNIDWDGIIHEPEKHIPETRNEIDVVLMRGLTPLFISCKNGNIGEEELYKLNTIASRFGGPYARKMLIATDLDRKSVAADRSFIQRAWDMDIFLVPDGAALSSAEWRDVFKQAMQ